MITKTFVKNINGKIEFTERELSEILDEIYRDGYKAGKGQEIFTYTTPYWWNINKPTWTYTTTPAIVKNHDNITTCNTNTNTNTNTEGEKE